MVGIFSEDGVYREAVESLAGKLDGSSGKLINGGAMNTERELPYPFGSIQSHPMVSEFAGRSTIEYVLIIGGTILAALVGARLLRGNSSNTNNSPAYSNAPVETNVDGPTGDFLKTPGAVYTEPSEGPGLSVRPKEPAKNVYTDPLTGESGVVIWRNAPNEDGSYGYALDQNSDGVKDLVVSHYGDPVAYREEFPSLDMDTLTYIERDTSGDNKPDVVEVWINGKKNGAFEYRSWGVDAYLFEIAHPEEIPENEKLRIN